MAPEGGPGSIESDGAGDEVRDGFDMTLLLLLVRPMLVCAEIERLSSFFDAPGDNGQGARFLSPAISEVCDCPGSGALKGASWALKWLKKEFPKRTD